MVKFRFQDLKIWQLSIQIDNELCDIAESSSKREFKQFLNMARRSAFEVANILILLQSRNMISQESLEILLDKVDYLGRQITNFRNSLK
ncbi:MAG TPA: four helix bundle protein [Thermodesulfobacteriota bacterium]|nr:four helix bundle protein [Thermodesulfobacteriota bacterium]